MVSSNFYTGILVPVKPSHAGGCAPSLGPALGHPVDTEGADIFCFLIFSPFFFLLPLSLLLNSDAQRLWKRYHSSALTSPPQPPTIGLILSIIHVNLYDRGSPLVPTLLWNNSKPVGTYSFHREVEHRFQVQSTSLAQTQAVVYPFRLSSLPQWAFLIQGHLHQIASHRTGMPVQEHQLVAGRARWLSSSSL